MVRLAKESFRNGSWRCALIVAVLCSSQLGWSAVAVHKEHDDTATSDWLREYQLILADESRVTFPQVLQRGFSASQSKAISDQLEQVVQAFGSNLSELKDVIEQDFGANFRDASFHVHFHKTFQEAEDLFNSAENDDAIQYYFLFKPSEFAQTIAVIGYRS